ncbi:mitochondrial ornithine transporter 1 isoform X2 [Periplaneta americana]
MGPEGSSNSFKDAAIDFTAGSVGGVGLVYVGQPLDTIKVKMQTFPTLYRGMVDCFRETLFKEGITRGLYAGTVPAIVANVAENSVLFAAYGTCQKAMMIITNKEKAEDLSALANASAGFCAAFFSSFTLCPTELIKCQLQAMREVQMQSITTNSGHQMIGPWKLTQKIIQQEGIQGLFRGLGSTIAREMPGYFFFFGGYEATREILTPVGKRKDEIGPLRTMIAGAVGGIVFWAVIFPADVVKSRIQVSGLSGSLLPLILQISRKEGIRALYSGLQPTLVRTVPATATLFLLYETTKKVLHKLCD